MPGEILEALIAGYLATQQEQYSFCWQGGEPTLMGVEFFRKVTELQARRARRGSSIANNLQTNALLIDEDLAEHLAEYRFLVGVSLDGPADIHDAWRTTAGGGGSHAQVIRSIQRLVRHRVELNALTLVTPRNVDRGPEVYRYLRRLGIRYHQYIPCVEFDVSGAALPFTITGRQWGGFLCSVFDEWARADTRRVSVRNFDAPLQMLVHGTAAICTMAKSCGQYFVVEHNGDVYPCDFFVEESARVGNIMEDSWRDLLRAARFRSFARQKAQWNDACTACEFLSLCAGDCPRHRFYASREAHALSWLCEGWRRFYGHAVPTLERLAASRR